MFGGGEPKVGGEPLILISLPGCWPPKKGSDFVHSLVYWAALAVLLRAESRGAVVG